VTARFSANARGAVVFVLVLLAAPLSYSAPFSDFNKDGRSDVFWRNSVTGENYIYPMNGTSILGTEGYVRSVYFDWKVVGIGDFDGDGRADLLWRNSTTGQNYIYMMDGTAIVREGYIRTVADQNWHVVGVGDFDNDGKADILWRNTATGQNYVYPMDGLVIKPTEGFIRTVADQNWQVAGVGDFDGDGKADILWRNSSSGQNYLYPMDGTSIKPTEGFIRTVADLDWQVAGVCDVDADLKADIVWRNLATGENYVFRMSGTTILGTEGYIRTIADPDWQVAAVGDYNGDGACDILWRNTATGDAYIYPMQGLSILPSEGYTRTVADPFWVPIGASPPHRFQQLPMTLDTLWAAGDIWTGSREADVAASCGGSPTVNCPGGIPGNPPPPLALTRTAGSVAQTADPAVYSFSAQISVVSLTGIPISFSGVSCAVSINTAPGPSPTVQVTGTGTFGRNVLGDPVNRLDLANVQVSGLTAEDFSLTGGFMCNFSNYQGIVIGYFTSYLADVVRSRPHLCGAPGAPLFMDCPVQQ